MTNAGITRAVAEKVIGWRLGPDFVVNGGRLCLMLPERLRPDNIAVEWCPLTSDADACAVLDKMAEDGWEYTLEVGLEAHDRHTVCIYERQDMYMDRSSGWPESRPFFEIKEITPAARRRAICLAALKAVGAEELIAA